MMVVPAWVWVVHPHMRGDSTPLPTQPRPWPGSPPHAWGQLSGSLTAATPGRFTPTCVGTAHRLAHKGSRSRVHPHMRGDSRRTYGSGNNRNGSPPHAWGQPEQKRADALRKRFTPTCVGTARTKASRCVAEAVHPHMRGDSPTSGVDVAIRDGSPPHAWGQQTSRDNAATPQRFTPTCVGTAIVAVPDLKVATVHPHMRGDSRLARGSALPFEGSPPHAWGQHKTYPNRIMSQRFTPTCVGTAEALRPPPCFSRFTPTCVGTAYHLTVQSKSIGVHPHMRGDSR